MGVNGSVVTMRLDGSRLVCTTRPHETRVFKRPPASQIWPKWLIDYTVCNRSSSRSIGVTHKWIGSQLTDWRQWRAFELKSSTLPLGGAWLSSMQCSIHYLVTLACTVSEGKGSSFFLPSNRRSLWRLSLVGCQSSPSSSDTGGEGLILLNGKRGSTDPWTTAAGGVPDSHAWPEN